MITGRLKTTFSIILHHMYYTDFSFEPTQVEITESATTWPEWGENQPGKFSKVEICLFVGPGQL